MKFISRNFGVIIIYLILTLALTYPVAARFNTHLAGDDGDAWQNVWNMWWMKECIVETHHNPYYTDYFHYPGGGTLLFYTLNPLNAVLSIPFQYIFSRIVIYNAIFVLAFAFCGFTMYLLAMYLTKNWFASIVAGFIFTFSPYHMSHGLGHLQLVSMEFIPLFILYLFKALENKGAFRHTLLASVFLILVALCDWYYLFFCVMLALLYTAYLWLAGKPAPRASSEKTLSILAIAFIALSPFFIAMAKEALKGSLLGAHPPEEYSADLLSFFIPNQIQALGRFFNFFQSINISFTGNIAENGNYIGYSVLFLSLCSLRKLVKDRKIVIFFFLSGIIFFMLSLGMHLHVMGRLFPRIPLPYNLLYKTFFFFRFTGIPERFDAMIVLCLSILAGFGLKNILLARQKGKKNFIITVVMILLFVEYSYAPFATSSSEIPRFFQDMANDKGDYAIIFISHPDSRKAFYYQTIHRKKIVWGDIGRYQESSEEFLRTLPIVRNILWDICPASIDNQQIPDHAVRTMARRVFNILKIRYVVIEKGAKNQFINYYKFAKIYEDGNVAVYEP